MLVYYPNGAPMVISDDKVREFAIGVLNSKEGRAKALFQSWTLQGYRRPDSLTVYAHGVNQVPCAEKEWVFEGDALLELRALAMQKALEK